MSVLKLHRTVGVMVGRVQVGGGAPIVVQSMTNTDTEDVARTVAQVKALADTEASLLARLIVANARMQSKIFNILSAEQQKKLSDLERTQGALTSDGK